MSINIELILNSMWDVHLLYATGRRQELLHCDNILRVDSVPERHLRPVLRWPLRHRRE